MNNIFNTNINIKYDINSLVSSLIYESKIIDDPNTHIISKDEINMIIDTISSIYNIDFNIIDLYDHIVNIYNIEKFNKNRKNYKDYILSLKNNDNIEQRTELWYKTRETLLTASDWASALGKNKYSSRNKILKDKSYGSTFYGNKYTQWGVKYEPIASIFYTLKTKKKVIDFGLIKHKKYDFLGASPDNITDNGIMLEIKCPYSREITGDVPFHYWIQMQAQLEVCELERCDYLECKLSEFDNEDSYYESDNLNKGCIIEIYDDNDKIIDYNYSDFNLNKQDILQWKNDFMININNDYTYKITYWKLDKYLLIPIYRDKSWFNDNIEKLEIFWNEVKLNRQNYNDLFD